MRLTIDIDGKHRDWYAWGLFYSLRDSGEFTEVELYETAKGFHIVAYGSGLSEYEMLQLRRALGDDPLRVELDRIKHPLMPKNVLFVRKNGREVRLLCRERGRLRV